MRVAVASEGVYLSEEGNNFIKSLTVDLYVPRHKRGGIKGIKNIGRSKRTVSEMEAGILAVIESVVSGAGITHYKLMNDSFVRSYFYVSHNIYDFPLVEDKSKEEKFEEELTEKGT